MSETPVPKGTNANTIVLLERRNLLVRHREGDPSAFSELVSLFRSQVYSYIVRCGVDEGARDDVFQEVFLKVHCNAQTYLPEKPLEPWFFTIVANTVRTHYRRSRVREIITPGLTDAERDSSPDAESHAGAKETLEWLEGAIRRLPFAQREVLTLSSFSNLNQKDIGKILDLPVNTVKTHLSRARASLTKQLTERNDRARKEVSE